MDIRPQQLLLGPQVCGTLAEAAAREWLVTDGAGGFAMGTVAGLRTRRYHGLLVVATEPPIGRRLGLAALDPVIVIDGTRYELATHRWASGATAPSGHRFLTEFALVDGVPRWRWSIEGVVVQAELAMAHGRPAVGVAYEVVSVPPGAEGLHIGLELTALATWRDVHGERFGDADPAVDHLSDGFGFEGAYRPWHRGGPAERDAAYHQGTVWPWLIGPWVDACRRAGAPPGPTLDSLVAHLGDWGLGSVSETADGDAPHGATGCPFQAWSVAELLRVRRP